MLVEIQRQHAGDVHSIASLRHLGRRGRSSFAGRAQQLRFPVLMPTPGREVTRKTGSLFYTGSPAGNFEDFEEGANRLQPRAPGAAVFEPDTRFSAATTPHGGDCTKTNTSANFYF